LQEPTEELWRFSTPPPADDSVSLSSFGGEGRGEERRPSRPEATAVLLCHSVCALERAWVSDADTIEIMR